MNIIIHLHRAFLLVNSFKKNRKTADLDFVVNENECTMDKIIIMKYPTRPWGEDIHDHPNSSLMQATTQHFALLHMCWSPKDSHETLPISVIQGDHLQQHLSTYLHSMDIDSP